MEEINKSYYAIIPANVRYDKDLKANAKLLYGEITALCNEKGYCWATNKYFAELYGVSERSITDWIKNLCKKKYISTKLIYGKDSKMVEERRIYLGVEENFHTYRRNLHEGIEENFQGGIEENFQDNNTVINNTINISSKEEKKETIDRKLLNEIKNKWNLLGVTKVISLKCDTERYRSLHARIDRYGKDKVLEAIDNISNSDYLLGKVKSEKSKFPNWKITFEWFVNENNFLKILEGNYNKNNACNKASLEKMML